MSLKRSCISRNNRFLYSGTCYFLLYNSNTQFKSLTNFSSSILILKSLTLFSTFSKTNLLSLGYQDLEEPTSISFYFKDFTSKENFIDFLDEYNENVDDEKINDFIIEDGNILGVIGKDKYYSDTVVLAIGHSARDTFEMLNNFDIFLK